MLLSLALIFLTGLSMARIVQKLHLPRIVGMLVAGILLGPYVCNVLDPTILSVSAVLRKIALIIILIKAGLTLNIQDLKKAGKSAILLSFVPASFELVAYVVLAPKLLGITYVEAAIMGSVLAAVSPAVVVPRMVEYIEKGYGTQKAIPQRLLAGASCDDIFVIVLFSTFLAMAKGGQIQWTGFLNIPLSIVLGILAGIVVGMAVSILFNHTELSVTLKVVVLLSVSFILVTLEDVLQPYFSMSGLLAVVAMAVVVKMQSRQTLIKHMSCQIGNIWQMAEILLFVLVGAEVNIQYTFLAGPKAVVLIIMALFVRSLGVLVSVAGSDLDIQEKLFCIVSYFPKATVQAAIGGVALANGLACGEIILSVAVLGILITAPLGAIGMDSLYAKCLKKSAE